MHLSYITGYDQVLDKQGRVLHNSQLFESIVKPSVEYGQLKSLLLVFSVNINIRRKNKKEHYIEIT